MSDIMSYLFRTICQPTLLYCLNAFDLNNNMMKTFENAQGGIMQRVCGIPKRSHNTVITGIKYIYAYKIINLNVYVNSPLPDLCVYDLTACMACSKTTPGTIIPRLT